MSCASAKERPSGPEEVPTALLSGHAGGIHAVGEHDHVLLFGELGHGRPDGAPRTAAEELHAVFQDQVLCLARGHVRLELRVDGDDFHLLSQQTAALVDDLGCVLHALQVSLADVLERSGERLRCPDLDGVLSRRGTRQREQDGQCRQSKQLLHKPVPPIF
jgi:hypothetical protein